MDNSIRKHNENLDKVEKLIDDLSASYVIELMAETCSSKADHIMNNWQDAKLVMIWDHKASGLLSIIEKMKRLDKIS